MAPDELYRTKQAFEMVQIEESEQTQEAYHPPEQTQQTRQARVSGAPPPPVDSAPVDKHWRRWALSQEQIPAPIPTSSGWLLSAI